MSTAFIPCFNNDPFFLDGMVRMQVTCFFFDDSVVPMVHVNMPIDIAFPPDSTPTQIENIVEDAIANVATQNFLGSSFPRSSMIFPDLKRGN
jgi:hypothetical protein